MTIADSSVRVYASCIEVANWRRVGGVAHDDETTPPLVPRNHVRDRPANRATLDQPGGDR